MPLLVVTQRERDQPALQLTVPDKSDETNKHANPLIIIFSESGPQAWLYTCYVGQKQGALNV